MCSTSLSHTREHNIISSTLMVSDNDSKSLQPVMRYGCLANKKKGQTKDQTTANFSQTTSHEAFLWFPLFFLARYSLFCL